MSLRPLLIVLRVPPLLRSLRPPYPPLKANTIGSITKKLLSDLGVPMGILGAHTTRGAGSILQTAGFVERGGLCVGEVEELFRFHVPLSSDWGGIHCLPEAKGFSAQRLTYGKCGARPVSDSGECKQPRR